MSPTDLTSSAEQHLHTVCTQTFLGVNSYFKPFANKLKKICNTHQKCGNLTDESLAEIKNCVVDTLTFFTVKPEHPWVHICNDIVKGNAHLRFQKVLTFFRTKFEHITIAEEGHAGRGVGVKRSFYQKCLDDIQSHKFFIPVEAGSDRCALNPAVTVESLRELGYDVNNEYDVEGVYSALGCFIAHLLANGLPLSFKLSHGVLAHLIFREQEISGEEYVFYSLMDVPSTNSLLNLMKLADVDQIAETMMEFNDDYELSGSNKPVTKDNFERFLIARSKHQLVREVLPKPKTFDTMRRLKAMIGGFFLRKTLRREKVSVKQLDGLFVSSNITAEKITDLVNNRLTRGHAVDTVEPDHMRKIFKYLKDILQDDGASFPHDVIQDSDRVPTDDEKKDMFREFFTKLLYFWTGSKHIDDSRNYQVLFLVSGLPKASTCFFQLKLPVYVSSTDRTVLSKEALYRKLVTAVYNVEAGVGLYGGRKKK